MQFGSDRSVTSGLQSETGGTLPTQHSTISDTTEGNVRNIPGGRISYLNPQREVITL